jgi:hypothetical protein
MLEYMKLKVTLSNAKPYRIGRDIDEICELEELGSGKGPTDGENDALAHGIVPEGGKEVVVDGYLCKMMANSQF